MKAVEALLMSALVFKRSIEPCDDIAHQLRMSLHSIHKPKEHKMPLEMTASIAKVRQTNVKWPSYFDTETLA